MEANNIDELKRQDQTLIQSWLDSNGIKWREGKDQNQLIQVKIGTDWMAIHTSAEAMLAERAKRISK